MEIKKASRLEIVSIGLGGWEEETMLFCRQETIIYTMVL